MTAHMLLAGIPGTLVYGVVVINSQFVPTIRLVWREVRPAGCTITRHPDVTMPISCPALSHCSMGCSFVSPPLDWLVQ